MPSRLRHIPLPLLRVNYYVFHRNYQELDAFLEAIQAPQKLNEFWGMTGLSAIELETTRQLHNYLSAAKTLVDHTRVLMNDAFAGTPFLAEYNREVERRFVDNPMCGFIEGLRNYTVHYALPIAGRQVTLDNTVGVPDLALTLNVPRLLQWSNWPAKAKVYLDTAAENIRIGDTADAYFVVVAEFHDWLQKRLVQYRDQMLREA